MIGLLAGPEPRTERPIDQISGVSQSSRSGPMAQPVGDLGTSRRAQLVCPPGHSQVTRGSEMPCVPTPSLLTRTAKRITPVAHSTVQTALRTAKSAHGSQLTPSSKSWHRDHQVALREGHNLTSRKRNTRRNTTKRTCSPTTGPATHPWPPARYAPRTLSTPHARATSCRMSTCRQESS
jgi:hypothetical protein